MDFLKILWALSFTTQLGLLGSSNNNTWYFYRTMLDKWDIIFLCWRRSFSSYHLLYFSIYQLSWKKRHLQCGKGLHPKENKQSTQMHMSVVNLTARTHDLLVRWRQPWNLRKIPSGPSSNGSVTTKVTHAIFNFLNRVFNLYFEIRNWIQFIKSTILYINVLNPTPLYQSHPMCLVLWCFFKCRVNFTQTTKYNLIL